MGNATSTLGSPPVDSESESEGWLALNEVLSSPAFERSPTLRNLLKYLWEHRNEDISEYAIGTEALRRKPDFDPRTDATVRVLVSRLRQRLKEFYEKAGSGLTSRLVIPAGTYKIRLVQMDAMAPQPEVNLLELQRDEQTDIIQRSAFSRSILWAQFVLIVALSLSVAWLIRRQNVERTERLHSDSPRVPAFWKQFSGNGRNTRVVVPTPTFFTWKGSLLARDVEVNDFMGSRDSEYLERLKRQLGEPSLAQQYVASYDAVGAFRLIQYLDSHGLQSSLSTTAQTSLEELDKENIILEGNGHTLSSFSYLLRTLSFKLDQNNLRVIDLRPASGHPAYYDPVQESPSRVISPAIFASIPGAAAGTHVLVLLSTSRTPGLVDYLISDAGMKELERVQAEHGNCQYFEAVVLITVDGSNTLSGKIANFRPYVSK